MAKNLTIRDISKLTGFSRSTVSLVLNNSPKVGEETREKILRVMEEHDYHPSAQARGLASRRSRSVAVVVPPIRRHLFSDYYYAEALGGISEVAAEKGFGLVLELATPQFFEERKHYGLFKTGAVAGMLFVGASERDTYIRDLGAEHYPIILVNSRNEITPAIVADNFSGTREGIRHLVRLGHRRIACITAPQHITTSRDRTTGWRAALEEAGLELDQCPVVEGNWDVESGYHAARDLLRRVPRPTAVFAVNDMMAFGTLRAAKELGLSVPMDLSVMGADDVQPASLVTPGLTTIRQPIYEIARLAMGSLLESLERPEPPESRKVPTELVLRESCSPPAR